VAVSVEPSEKSVEIMRKFSEQYARKSGTYFCVDKGVTSVVIKVCVETGLNLPCYYED
jgi:ferredoxin-thioredoxin reductase catalytic chain